MSFTELKGFDSLGENLLDDQLRANIISFLDWGFLNKGNFHNIYLPSSGLYGGNKETLKPIKDPRYTQGKVWQAFRGNWVWQSGLTCDVQPIQYSGVYVNNTFQPASGIGTYAHYVDYPRGRIVFDTAIPITSTVKAEYSYKHINVVDINEVDFVKEIQTGSFRLDSPAFLALASGDYAVLPDTKIQTPFIAVEVSADTKYRPYQLGGGQYTQTKVLCHIMTDEEKLGKKISAVIGMQNEKCIKTFDVNEISQNNLSPLTYKGSIATGALTHPQMVETYEWRKLCIVDSQQGQGMWFDSIYYIPSSFRAEVILNNI